MSGKIHFFSLFPPPSLSLSLSLSISLSLSLFLFSFYFSPSFANALYFSLSISMFHSLVLSRVEYPLPLFKSIHLPRRPLTGLLPVFTSGQSVTSSGQCVSRDSHGILHRSVLVSPTPNGYQLLWPSMLGYRLQRASFMYRDVYLGFALSRKY